MARLKDELSLPCPCGYCGRDNEVPISKAERDFKFRCLYCGKTNEVQMQGRDIRKFNRSLDKLDDAFKKFST